MLKTVVARAGGRAVIVTDTITKLDADDAGAIAVSGSHGGTSSAEFALAQPLACAFFNDAGVGKDGAGIAALAMLDAAGVPAVAVSHDSARIGDAADMWAFGRVSHVNAAAQRIGIVVGESVRGAVARFGPLTD
ncbi:MAG: hypothetical protein R3E87_03070 [Burkholderiaceae bacterium]